MIRPVFTELALFLIPFALYALYVWATKTGGVLDRGNWPTAHVIWLLIAAFFCVIISFVVLAHWGGSPPNSTYVPAHIENGKLVPGENR